LGLLLDGDGAEDEEHASRLRQLLDGRCGLRGPNGKRDDLRAAFSTAARRTLARSSAHGSNGCRRPGTEPLPSITTRRSSAKFSFRCAAAEEGPRLCHVSCPGPVRGWLTAISPNGFESDQTGAKCTESHGTRRVWRPAG
jgi:hypothetical protein